MALEGSLREFGLADILQLLYYQRKTGVLTLESRLDRVRLLFYEGKIVLAESKKRPEGNRLGRILLKKGIVPENELRMAMEEQRKTGAKLGHILLKKSLAKKEQIQEILTVQITEIVTQLLAWKEGRYEFKPQGVPVDKDIPLSLDTQHLLMDGLRVVDEWTLIEGKINLDSVFEKTQKTDVVLTYDEQEILKLVDGVSNVNAITDASGIDSFQVSKTLLALLDKGIVAPKQVLPIAKEAVKPKAVGIPGIRIIPLLAILIALFISLISLPEISRDIKDIKTSKEIDVLRQEIEAYWYEKGSYPLTVKQIGDTTDLWGQPYSYTLIENGFVLFSKGPDAKEGTEDDIY
ncbi:MAG: DUF4388 domain-containing protein [Nitrospirae bacterium]|nr:DUF4388 domain-containing protein [Nitrospirota bacterium]